MESLMKTLDAKALAPEVQFRDVVTGAVTRRYAGKSGGFFSQGWVTSDGKRLVLIQRSYWIVPRNFAEWHALRARPADSAVSLLIVPLEPRSAANSPRASAALVRSPGAGHAVIREVSNPHAD
jgi:hypothetical protein